LVNVIRILATINSDASYVDSNITWTNNNEMTLRFETDEVKDILDKHGATSLDDIVYGDPLFDELMDYFAEDMPYGVQKARTGMPDEWIVEHLDYLGFFKDEEISEEEQERANHIAKSQDRGEM